MNQKILIVGPAWVGDMVMAQTLFKLIKQNQPASDIHVLAPAWTKPLLDRMPEVSHSWVSPFKHGELALRKRWSLATTLRKEKYDQAIVLPNSLKSALIPFVARIPKRTGWKGEMRFGLLNDIRSLDKEALPLMIERFMALGLENNASLPASPSLPCLKTAEKDIDEALTKAQLVRPQKLLVLCPGAEYGPAKRWLPEYFAEVAKQKYAEGYSVWIFGSPKDVEMSNKIQEVSGGICVDLAGKTSLSEAIDLMSLATAVISNDSGLMHIAAALDLPMVALYGSSSPKFTPPLSDRVVIESLDLECSPCFKRDCPLGHFKCMRDLKPERILQALDDVIEKWGKV